MGKQEIFQHIREALADITTTDAAEDVPIPWDFGQPTAVGNVIDLFIERVIDYKATVQRVSDESEIPALVSRFLVEAGAATCVVPPGLNDAWYVDARSSGIEVLFDDPPMSKQALDNVSAVLTAAFAGMAETGTIALDHRPDQGRRIISLLPDTHIVVIHADQVVTDVPEAVSRLAPSIRAGQPITWISGPSATSDIELSRVEGVHGPRNLYVIIVG